MHLSINGIAMSIKCEYWSARDDLETLSFVIIGERIAMPHKGMQGLSGTGLELQLRGPIWSRAKLLRLPFR